MPTTDRRPLVARAGDLPVLVKILTAIVITLVVGVTVGVLGLTKLSATAREVDAMYEVQVKPLGVLAQAQRMQQQLRIDNLLHATSQDDASMLEIETEMVEHGEQLAELLAQYRVDAADQAAVDAFTADWAEVIAFRDQVLLPLSRVNDMAGFQQQRSAGLAPLTATAEAHLTTAFEAEAAQAADRAERADAAYTSARTTIVAALVAGSVLALGLGVLVARQITGSLRAVSRVATGLAAGDLTVRADVASRDEVGRMAAELDTATASLRETVQALEQNALALAGASEELNATSMQIAAAAEETGVQAGVVSAAAGEVSSNIQTVAAGSEQMGASIREISTSTSEASRVASQAVHLAQTTNATVTKLGDSSKEIGDVVKVITSIAEQTNLLALNATIEAARAGEAGKGFAVVANEVKELAQETARATEDIATRVASIQTDTAGAVGAISEIAAVIDRISEFQTTVASAVEEQTATTAEVVRNVAEAASGASQIADNVTGVAEAAQTTSAGVTQAQAASAELARMSGNLQRIVGQFRL